MPYICWVLLLKAAVRGAMIPHGKINKLGKEGAFFGNLFDLFGGCSGGRPVAVPLDQAFESAGCYSLFDRRFAAGSFLLRCYQDSRRWFQLFGSGKNAVYRHPDGFGIYCLYHR